MYYFHDLKVEHTCSFEAGYTYGASDKHIGDTESAQKCLELVKNVEPTANGITWENFGSQRCIAELGAIGILADCQTCQSCIFGGRLMYMPYHNNV